MMEVLILINPIPLVWRTILGVAALWYGWRRRRRCGVGVGGAQGETALNSHQLKGGNVKNAVDSVCGECMYCVQWQYHPNPHHVFRE